MGPGGVGGGRAWLAALGRTQKSPPLPLVTPPGTIKHDLIQAWLARHPRAVEGTAGTALESEK